MKNNIKQFLHLSCIDIIFVVAVFLDIQLIVSSNPEITTPESLFLSSATKWVNWNSFILISIIVVRCLIVLSHHISDISVKDWGLTTILVGLVLFPSHFTGVGHSGGSVLYSLSVLAPSAFALLLDLLSAVYNSRKIRL